ncbi:hypothetical protein [Pedobacter sp. SYSU D00535]|uniref:hypothetical protein n=1 Tax=Pedobacter sp. SYSU D00535 TaxID=2810308 RepID=UPI001A96D277|nr:hypothetical protein [Pedobacter sp. SYSU D00535]
MKKLVLFFFSFVYFLSASGQLPNDSLEYRIRPDTLKSGDVQLSLYNFNFLRNYEFFNNFQDGYTLFGTQLEPRLVYYPNSKLVLSAGVHVRKDFGKQGINKSFPLFTIKYQNGNTALINGVLEGNINHRFIEPLFDFERKISNPVEYGTQLVVDKRTLFLDAFVNWNKMIERNSPEQEQIFAGVSSDIAIYKQKALKVSVPLQVFAFHQGGQIDTDPAPLQTVVNAALGIKFQWNRTGFLKHLKTENYFVTYTDLSPHKQQVYSNGTGWYFNAGLGTWKYGSLLLSYWEGHKYISPVGMPIYQSLSRQINHPGYSEALRQLVFLRYTLQRQLVANFYLDFRVEPIFDLKSPGSKPMEFFHSLFLVYKQDFRLFKRK